MAKPHLIGGAIVLLTGIPFAYLSFDLMFQNANAINVITTLFSFLAGFSVAVATIVGDPSSVLHGGWRVAIADKERIGNRLIRLSILFFIYLFTLLFIFLAFLLEKSYPRFSEYLTYAFSYTFYVGFLFSLTLPTKIMTSQMNRIENLIEKRKEDEKKGIKVE